MNSNYTFCIKNVPEEFIISTKSESIECVDYIQVSMNSPEETIFPPITLQITFPSSGIHYHWTPKIHLIKALNLDWFNQLYTTNGFTGAPVESYLSSNQQNVYTFALSDTLNTTEVKGIAVEETADYSMEFTLLKGESVKRNHYVVTIRIDTRPIPYYESLKEVSLWWESLEGNQPAFVPALAKEAMYSTWYSFHQNLTQQALLKECELAKQLGLKSILIDDGWQTEDTNRGYAYCGDWEVAPSKIQNMKTFVEQVHRIGLNVIPWYSVPYIGKRSKNFSHFQNMLIDPINDREWCVLDPRYKEVREFIIQIYEKALMNWNLDGFKLDFIDEFVVTPFSGKEFDSRRDFISISEAADALMKQIIYRLKQIKEDIMLEFRQTYNGPLMRSYGNIFRAVDCPMDDLENRVRVTDIRLLIGNSAVHSDMIMWHKEDSPESAALQIINILFSVPQISMRLENLPEKHLKMLTFYLKLWHQYKNAFINGSFHPLNPACRYNIIYGIHEDTFVCACHSNEAIPIKQLYSSLLLVNGSSSSYLIIENCRKVQTYHIKVFNCLGELYQESDLLLHDRLNQIDVPPSGVIQLEKQ